MVQIFQGNRRFIDQLCVYSQPFPGRAVLVVILEMSADILQPCHAISYFTSVPSLKGVRLLRSVWYVADSMLEHTQGHRGFH